MTVSLCDERRQKTQADGHYGNRAKHHKALSLKTTRKILPLSADETALSATVAV